MGIFERRRAARAAKGAVCVALLTGVLATGASTSGAAEEELEVSNVAASITAPAVATGAFGVTATITNTGNVPQVPGATITVSAINGSVVSAAAGCVVAAGVAECTVTQVMVPGESRSFSATVAPAPGAATVTSKAVTQGSQPDLNAPSSPADDTATATTSFFALGIDLTNDPTKVSPGNDTRLDAAVTNLGAPQSAVTLTIVTGGTVDTRLPLPGGCSLSGGGGTVTCSLALGIGETAHRVVAVTTPTSGTSMTSTATVSGENGSSASDSTVTTLELGAGEAYVPPGGSACDTDTEVSSCIFVPSTWEGGTVVGLHQRFLPGKMCGTALCAPYMAEANWPHSDHPSHNDVNNPLVLRITYNVAQSCSGWGWGSGCHQIFHMKDVHDTPQAVPQCSTYSKKNRGAAVMSDVNTPCLNFVERGPTDFVTYDVALLIDPVIPKIGQ